MSSPTYHVPPGGHPAQTELLTGRAVFTNAYAVIPKGVIRDIVTSYLPHWDNTRVWVLARPLSGFAGPFSHYLIAVAPGGGSESPEPDAGAEGRCSSSGRAFLQLAGTEHVLRPVACLPASREFLERAKSQLRFSAFSLDPEAVPACA
jgi:(S)-ureidoglycine aminohydrolase